MNYPRPRYHSALGSSCRQLEPSFTGLAGSACQQVGFGSDKVGVQAALVRAQGPPDQETGVFPGTQGSWSFLHLGPRGGFPPVQTGSGGSHLPLFSGLLRPDICGEESVGGLETRLGPLPPQRLSKRPSFSYGDPPVCQGVSPPG